MEGPRLRWALALGLTVSLPIIGYQEIARRTRTTRLDPVQLATDTRSQLLSELAEAIGDPNIRPAEKETFVRLKTLMETNPHVTYHFIYRVLSDGMAKQQGPSRQ